MTKIRTKKTLSYTDKEAKARWMKKKQRRSCGTTGQGIGSETGLKDMQKGDGAHEANTMEHQLSEDSNFLASTGTSRQITFDKDISGKEQQRSAPVESSVLSKSHRNEKKHKKPINFRKKKRLEKAMLADLLHKDFASLRNSKEYRSKFNLAKRSKPFRGKSTRSSASQVPRISIDTSTICRRSDTRLEGTMTSIKMQNDNNISMSGPLSPLTPLSPSPSPPPFSSVAATVELQHVTLDARNELIDWEPYDGHDKDIDKDEEQDCQNLINWELLENVQDDQVRPLVDRPALPEGVRPIMWASSRQALCESFRWFRAYQSGVYHNRNIAYGYLLSRFSAKRDIFCQDGKLIISHGGGKVQVVSADNGKAQTIVASDQDEGDKSVRALLNTYKTGAPIVLLMDDKYQHFPYDLQKTNERYVYAVLGFYVIVNAWAEKEMANNSRGECVKFKFAFQWCDNQSPPWWLAHANPLPQMYDAAETYTASDNNLSPVPPSIKDSDRQPTLLQDSKPEYVTNLVEVCKSCKSKSLTVFEEGWMCLRPGCPHFFQIKKLAFCPAHIKKLTYHPQFLELRSLPEMGKLDLIAWQSLATSKDCPVTCIRSTGGWLCDNCGQLCCREKWECWECSNCSNIESDPGVAIIRSHRDFWSQEGALDSFKHHVIHQQSGVEVETGLWANADSSEHGFRLTYTLPVGRGRIHLLTGNAKVNKRANDLFQLYQEEASKGGFFKRYPLQSHMLRGRMLSNYFSQNSGAPYKYIVQTNATVPFDKAPRAVTEALDLIKARASLVLGKPADFNEILSAGYMEKQRMSYHSDSEKGLGPVVSSLSLGSMAFMHFRLQKPYMERGHQRRRVLTLVLRHGDVLIMEGAEIQTVYEHTVVPKNFRIAATARFISQDP